MTFLFFSYYDTYEITIPSPRYEQSLENTEGAIKNGQSRETGNIG